MEQTLLLQPISYQDPESRQARQPLSHLPKLKLGYKYSRSSKQAEVLFKSAARLSKKSLSHYKSQMQPKSIQNLNLDE